MSRPTQAPISLPQLRRAIFLDFEGFKSGPPLMASVRVDGVTETVVFPDQSPELAIAAEASGLRLEPLFQFLHRVSEYATAEERRIVAYSLRELKVFEEGQINVSEVRSAWFDLLPPARDWRAREHPEIDAKVKRRLSRRRARRLWRDSSDNSLLAMSSLAGIERPAGYGPRRTTRRLRAVAEQIAFRGSFDQLTATAKRKWTNLIRHNRWDCEALEHLAKVVLASSDPC